MSDGAVLTIVTGVVNIAGLVVGAVVLYLRMRYEGKTTQNKVDAVVQDVTEVRRAAENAVRTAVVSASNTSAKLDRVVEQTATVVDAVSGVSLPTLYKEVLDLREALNLLPTTDQKVGELVEYSHKSKHDIGDALNAIVLKLERLVDTSKKKE